MVAFAGGARFFRPSEDIADSFLSKASKKSPANPNPITGAELTLSWSDGAVDIVPIPPSLSHNREEEKVKYLPQRFVERLCAPENIDQLEEEIERVIFQRIDKTERLEASNFQELRNSSTGALQIRRSRLARTIESLNQSIADTSARVALRPQKVKELNRKKEELQALLKDIPKVPEENKAELERLDALTKEKQEVEKQVVRYVDQLTILDTIEVKLEGLKQEISTFTANITPLLERVELTSAIDSFRIQFPDSASAALDERRKQLSISISRLKEGDPSAPSQPSLTRLNSQIEEIKAQSQLARVKQQEFDKFERDRKQLEDTCASLEHEIKQIDDVHVPALKKEHETRVERYADQEAHFCLQDHL
jgi:septal ring factor EnvC (AmiA/AmiB activator)